MQGFLCQRTKFTKNKFEIEMVTLQISASNNFTNSGPTKKIQNVLKLE